MCNIYMAGNPAEELITGPDIPGHIDNQVTPAMTTMATMTAR